MKLFSKRLLAVAAGAAALACVQTARAAPACRASDADLTAAIRAVHDKQKNVGVQAAIWRDGAVTFSTGVGLADRERGAPVTRETRFPIASVTKAFTGVVTLNAIAAGKLDPDAPIQTYVPEFPVKPELVITPRRLAAHRAGIHHWGPERDALFSRHFDRLEDVVALFSKDPLLADAGKEYQYSSYGYNLLALAVERAAGERYARLVQGEIIGPLGLTHTRLEDARHPSPNQSKLYSFYDLKNYYELPKAEPVPARDYSHNMAAGNMVSTAEDLVRFGAALLRPGLVPPKTYDMLFERPAFGGEATAMTFGVFASKPGAERRLSISGANPGVQAGLVVYPERGMTVAVLANTWGVDSRSGEMGSDLPQRLADLCAPATPKG